MTDYTKLEQIVKSNSDVILDMADKVWDWAELGFKEQKSSAYEAAVLEKNGFKMSDRGIGGLDTSWIATWGTGSPVVGIMVEFDALPDLGNEKVPTKTPREDGVTNGHGCGHNLIGSGAVGAAISLKAHMEKEGIAGTIKVFGCPAEELLKAARAEFDKRTGGKPYKSLNVLDAPPGGIMDDEARHDYECCIHGAMAHFGIKEHVV